VDREVWEWHKEWTQIDDFTEEDTKIIKAVRPYTLTIPVRIHALIQAVRYIIKNEIEGDMVECGVWKGGSMMAVAYALLGLGRKERGLYLYDTFEGMTQPTYVDFDYLGNKAMDRFNIEKKSENASTWALASLDEVKQNLFQTGYERARIHFVKGRVEDTLPKEAPEKIALLRLDTDWYESTLHELTHLYPRLSRGGILIIDDYGHWKGSQLATDEYFSKRRIKIFLSRIDYAARLAVKLE